MERRGVVGPQREKEAQKGPGREKTCPDQGEGAPQELPQLAVSPHTRVPPRRSSTRPAAQETDMGAAPLLS